MVILADRWSQLSLEDLQAFVGEADDEGLTWEAKSDGTSRLHPGSIRKSVCGFSNTDRGGYLILGMARDEGAWALPGFAPPHDEPDTWISSVIHGGVDPVPRIEIQTFGVDGGRFASVVRVWPVSVPPAMTNGIVYERVSGQTLPVTESAQLHRLFQRGATALERAQQRMERELTNVDAQAVALTALPTVFAVCVAPTGVPSGVDALLFTQRFRQRAEQLLSTHLRPPAVGPMQPRRLGSVDQSTLALGLKDPFGSGDDASWVILRRDGAVTVGYSDKAANPIAWPAADPGRLKAAFAVACTAARDLGLEGKTRIGIAAFARPVVVVHRWAESLDEPNDAEVDGILREFRRATGDPAWEPESDEAG